MIVVTGLASEARIAAGPDVRTIVGAGAAKALRSALETALTAGTAGVLSFGVAGGLDERLAPGTWIVARSVVSLDEQWACDADWTRDLAARLPGSCVVDIAGVDDIAGTVAAKHASRSATGAAVIDTESHVAAAAAAAHHIPFAAFRVVIDDARTELPPAAMVAVDRDGRINRRGVLRSLARSPSQLPALLRTALHARAAFSALSRGRRLLGPGLACPHLGELLLDLR